MPSRHWHFAIGILFVGTAITAHAQGIPLARQAPPSSALFTRTLPLEQYAGSLSVATPPGQLRRSVLIDSLRLRAMAAAAPNQDTVRSVSADEIATTCNMPVFVRDSASMPPMPVMRSNATTNDAGRLRGCRNLLSGSR